MTILKAGIRLLCQECLFTDDWVCFYWGVCLSEISAAIRTLLWCNLSHGSCKSPAHNKMKELAGWKRSVSTSERFMCHSRRGYRGGKGGIKVHLCHPATTSKHTLIKTSAFSTDIQCNYVFVITLLSVWLLFTSLRSYFLLWIHNLKQ